MKCYDSSRSNNLHYIRALDDHPGPPLRRVRVGELLHQMFLSTFRYQPKRSAIRDPRSAIAARHT